MKIKEVFDRFDVKSNKGNLNFENTWTKNL